MNKILSLENHARLNLIYLLIAYVNHYSLLLHIVTKPTSFIRGQTENTSNLHFIFQKKIRFQSQHVF